MNESDQTRHLTRTNEMIKYLDKSRNQNLADTIPWLAKAIHYTKN